MSPTTTPTPPLPQLLPNTTTVLTPEPLNPTSFHPFGTAILSPLPQSLTAVPSTPPTPLHATHQPQPVSANQRTALKTSPISPLQNTYPAPSRENGYAKGAGLMSVFSCFPRRNVYVDQDGGAKLDLEILERHPFTTQTFCPFNFSSSSSSSSEPSSRPLTARSPPKKTYILIIVAPTLSSPTSTPPNPPDLSRVRAFIVPTLVDGALGVAVTYRAGTWHAPMVVLGDRRVDFLVSQFVNGRGADDVQEVVVGDGRGRKVVVDLKGLGLADGDEEVVEEGLWRAKL